MVLAGTGSSAHCIDRDFRNLRKRLSRAPSRSAGAAGESRYISSRRRLQEGLCGSVHGGPWRLICTRSRRSRDTSSRSTLGMEVLREMWVRRSDFRIDGNLKGFDFTRSLARVKAPSLVVIGDRDLVSTATADISRASLASSHVGRDGGMRAYDVHRSNRPVQSAARGVPELLRDATAALMKGTRSDLFFPLRNTRRAGRGFIRPWPPAVMSICSSGSAERAPSIGWAMSCG